MDEKQDPEQIHAGRADITQVEKNDSVPIDDELRAHFAESRKLLDGLERSRLQLEVKLKALEGQDEMSTSDAQGLASSFNRARRAASDVQRSHDRMVDSIASKI